MGDPNKSGRLLEFIVANLLRFLHIEYQHQFSPEIVGILGKQIRVDFFLPYVRGYSDGLYLECKRQECPGSTDEKIVALRENIIRHYRKPTIVVLWGRHSGNSLTYLRSNLGGNLQAAMTLDECAIFLEDLSCESGGIITRAYDPAQGLLFDLW